MILPLVDTHAHLLPSVYGEELPAVLQRARQAGVRLMVTIGSGYGTASIEEALAVARAEEDVRAAVGVHPHDASAATGEVLARLQEAVREPDVVLWGEIGLDYHYDRSPREVQRRVFALQLDLAREAGRPVCIHTREADADTVAILDEHQAWERGVLIHCFSHTPELGRVLVDRGALLSIPGIVTYPRATALHDAVRELPLDRMVIETDSPFLAPVPHRGKRNEPAHVARVAERIAELQGRSPAEVAAATTETALAFLGCA